MSEGDIDCQAVKLESEITNETDKVAATAEEQPTSKGPIDESTNESESKQEATVQEPIQEAIVIKETAEEVLAEKEPSVTGDMIQAEEQAKEIAQEVVNEFDLEEVTTPEVEQIDKSQQTEEKSKLEAESAIGTPLPPVGIQQEVSSTNHRDDERPKSRSSHRRPSYNSGRGYVGGSYQNYGLTYLPYKSNFEPSEAARRRADEFIKTLKL